MLEFANAPIKLIVSEYAAEYKTVWVQRSWRERLFTWPWRPWVKQKPEVEAIPKIFKFQIGGLFHEPIDYVVCHPSLEADLRASIDEHNANIKVERGQWRFASRFNFGIPNNFFDPNQEIT